MRNPVNPDQDVQMLPRDYSSAAVIRGHEVLYYDEWAGEKSTPGGFADVGSGEHLTL